MKKILSAVLCLLMLSSCGINTHDTPSMPSSAPAASSAPSGSQSTAVKTMISPSDASPIGADWTILGETFITLDSDFADVYLATAAKRGADGYIMWDDSQEWALTVVTDSETYVLFDKHLHGKLYIDVTTRGETPVISLIHTSTVGLKVTEYVYEDGAFYSQTVIAPDDNGNNIYSSIPEYME